MIRVRRFTQLHFAGVEMSVQEQLRRGHSHSSVLSEVPTQQVLRDWNEERVDNDG